MFFSNAPSFSFNFNRKKYFSGSDVRLWWVSDLRKWSNWNFYQMVTFGDVDCVSIGWRLSSSVRLIILSRSFCFFREGDTCLSTALANLSNYDLDFRYEGDYLWLRLSYSYHLQTHIFVTVRNRYRNHRLRWSHQCNKEAVLHLRHKDQDYYNLLPQCKGLQIYLV